ncbi:NUDIX hydrolase [Streptomyces seoulensis]|uniref:NUDIX hydrolase n=1 Tax=Streptomyces seoulensis TaxID=73044 RepID=UPI003C2D9F61
MTAELWDVSRLRFEETAPPALTAAQRTTMDARWAAAVRANPTLFDGPVAALAGYERDGAGGLSVSWTRLTYRFRALRGLPGAPAVAALFVAVLQPPGGTLEPPGDGGALDLELLRAHAARELAEETGSDTSAAALVPGPVVLGARGSLGFLFTAPPRPARELRERYAELARTETASGVEPEFDLELAAGRFLGA